MTPVPICLDKKSRLNTGGDPDIDISPPEVFLVTRTMNDGKTMGRPYIHNLPLEISNEPILDGMRMRTDTPYLWMQRVRLIGFKNASPGR